MREIIKNTWKHKWSNFLIMLQLILVITYFFMTSISVQRAFNICIEVPKVFGDKMNETLHLEVQEEGVDLSDFEKFCTELKEKHIINEIITCDLLDFESNELSDDVVGNLKVQTGMKQIKDFEMKEGRNFNEDDLKREKHPILVGSQLAQKNNLKVGDLIEESIEGELYEIIGILKENNRWFENSAANGVILSLDQQVVTLMEEEYVHMDYYCNINIDYKDGIIENIKAIADKYNVIVRPTFVNDELGEEYKDILDDNIYWLVFAIVIMVMITIGTATLSITHMYSRKKEIGVRMAVGYTTKKIVILFGGEIVLITLLAYIISCVIGMTFIGDGIEIWDGVVTYTGNVFSGKIALFGAIAAVCMCTPSAIALLINIKKYQPKNLIGGRE